MQLDKIITDAYNEFYAQNQELFKKNPIEYWRLASQYRYQKEREYKMKMGMYNVSGQEGNRKQAKNL